jgi:mono/diheme cytochrome c family protein
MTRLSELDTTKRRWPAVMAIVVGLLVAFVGGGWLFVYTGAFDIAADTPHSRPVYWLMQKVREYSIAARTSDPVPNDLGDQKRIASGAGQYAEMCATCHLAPGMKPTEISRGIYPRAPELRRGSALTPAEEFWVIKHGIKMTGMPAWGATNDDAMLWDVVAFLRKFPELTAEQYQALVNSAPKRHDQMMQQMEMNSPPGGRGSHQ